MLFTHHTSTKAFLLQLINLKVFCVLNIESYVIVGTTVFEFIQHFAIVFSHFEFFNGGNGCSLVLIPFKRDWLEHFNTSFTTTVGWAYFLLASESRCLTIVIKWLVVKCFVKIFNFEITPGFVGGCLPCLGHESHVEFLWSLVHVQLYWISVKPFSFIFRYHRFILRHISLENLTVCIYIY